MKIEHRSVAAFAIAAALALTVGCNKSDSGGTSGAASGAASAKPASTSTTAAATTTAAAAPKMPADPEPTITAGPKKPFEALVFRKTGDVGKSGWPKYDMYNSADKKVTYAAITAYAYDKDGKQVARTDTPLSWNGNLDSGKKTDWAVEIDSWGKVPVPATATSFEICYDSIKFDGDANPTSDTKLCPAQRPKGGVK